MKHLYSLAHLTLIDCSAPELVYIAARAGYDFVSPRLIPMGVPGEFACCPENTLMMRATKNALAETGLRLHDLELARILADCDPKKYEPAMAVAADMGAHHMISSAWENNGPLERDFIVDRYAELCDLARPYGLTVDLEFPTFSRLGTLQAAADIVRAADRPNGGILIDTLYIRFSSVDLDEIAALPRSWFHFLHITDAPLAVPKTREGMIHIARDARPYPGEGSIDFQALLDRLPPVTCSIELPNHERVNELGCEGHARRCLETAKQMLDVDDHTETPHRRYAS